MKFTVDEQIAQAIEMQLLTCRKGGGYSFDVVEVHRPKRREDRSIGHGVANLQLDTWEQGEPEQANLGLKVSRTAVWVIDVYIEPSDEDDRPIDQLRSNAIGEVERCLVAAMHADDGRPFGGLGYNAELRAPQVIVAPDGGTAGFSLTLAVTYRYLDTNPYQALN